MEEVKEKIEYEKKGQRVIPFKGWINRIVTVEQPLKIGPERLGVQTQITFQEFSDKKSFDAFTKLAQSQLIKNEQDLAKIDNDLNALKDFDHESIASTADKINMMTTNLKKNKVAKSVLIELQKISAFTQQYNKKMQLLTQRSWIEKQVDAIKGDLDNMDENIKR